MNQDGEQKRDAGTEKKPALAFVPKPPVPDGFPDLPLMDALKVLVAEKPKGKPRGYLAIADVIAALRCMSYGMVKEIASGKRPEEWYEDELTFQWVLLARTELELKFITSHDARLEGRVPETDETAAGVSVTVGAAR